MDIYILDSQLKLYAVIDSYESFIWTERYDRYGDFELYSPVTPELIDICQKDRYVSINESNRLMIIERIEIITEEEAGNHIKVTGRSLEQLLERRIIWNLSTFSDNYPLQNVFEALINDAIISPTISARQINNFVFLRSTDSRITSLTLDAQYLGDNLYEIIASKCQENKLGFKVEFLNNQFVFSVYSGDDRSYSQTENEYVIFSTEYENLSSSNYTLDRMSYKNVTLVGGEGEGSDRKFASIGTASGVDRREVFTDAQSVSSKVDGSRTLSLAEYTKLLEEKGEKALTELKEITGFSGEYSEGSNFEYKRDFNLGDIVEIEDSYGNNGKVRIIEWIISNEDNSFAQYPTFEMVEEE